LRVLKNISDQHKADPDWNGKEDWFSEKKGRKGGQEGRLSGGGVKEPCLFLINEPNKKGNVTAGERENKVKKSGKKSTIFPRTDAGPRDGRMQPAVKPTKRKKKRRAGKLHLETIGRRGRPLLVTIRDDSRSPVERTKFNAARRDLPHQSVGGKKRGSYKPLGGLVLTLLASG